MDTTTTSIMPGSPDANARPILGTEIGPLLGGDDAVAKKAARMGPRGTEPYAITIRGSAEWKEWLDRFADKMRLKPTSNIDLALAELAHQIRFREPPPRI